MIDDVGSAATPRRWASGRLWSVLGGVVLLAVAGIVTAIVVTRSAAPPTLVPALDDRPPNPAVGISGGSFPSHSDIFTVESGGFLCATRDVEITSISLYRPAAGIVLARWGFKNHGDKPDYMHAPVSLAKFGPFTSHTITQRCGVATYYAHLALELHRTQPGTQSFLGLRMTYQSDGRQKVAYQWEQITVTESAK